MPDRNVDMESEGILEPQVPGVPSDEATPGRPALDDEGRRRVAREAVVLLHETIRGLRACERLLAGLAHDEEASSVRDVLVIAVLVQVQRLRELREAFLIDWLFPDSELRELGFPPIEEFVGNGKWKSFEILRRRYLGQRTGRAGKWAPPRLASPQALGKALRGAGLWDVSGFVRRLLEELVPGLEKVRDALVSRHPDAERFADEIYPAALKAVVEPGTERWPTGGQAQSDLGEIAAGSRVPTDKRPKPDSLSQPDLDEAERAVGVSVGDLAALLLLQSLKGFGPQKFKELYAAGYRAPDILDQPSRLLASQRAGMFQAELEATIGRSRATCHDRATRQILAAHKHRAVILTYDHPGYPRNVFESNNPTPILYARGSLELLTNRNAIACVGSRKIRSPYTELHREFARTACRLGFAIVAGFALGADTIGHIAAWHEGGQTICVMPCGLDRSFPPENKNLWRELLGYSGATFVTEFPFGTTASALTLRRRNKLIVGLARGVLISQSSVDGGAMNAYRFAVEQRKQVATFAHDDTSETSGNRLIAEAGVVFSTPPEADAFERWLQGLCSSI